MSKEYRYSEITGAIIGAAMQVHSELGNGFPEVIYQRSLAIEFQNQNISYKQEESVPLYYKRKICRYTEGGFSG